MGHGGYVFLLPPTSRHGLLALLPTSASCSELQLTPFWRRTKSPTGQNKQINTFRLPLIASVGGSILTRTISRKAFEKNGRATMTTDMIPEIEGAFKDVFEKKTAAGQSTLLGHGSGNGGGYRED